MATRLLYNYKQGDTDLGTRIDELNLKLDFGVGDTLQSRINDAVTTAVNGEQALREAADTQLSSRLEAMQLEIDGAISTYFLAGVPTDENEPAELWEDEETCDQHLGDLYYDTQTGYCYRWMKLSGEYSWELIKDTDVTTALANAAAAQATADSKAQTYVGNTAPTMQNTPASQWANTDYAKHDGDLFFDSTTGYLYRFQNGATPGWTRMKDSDITTAQATADSKAATYTGNGAPTLANAPASGWNAADYPKHQGDLYFDLDTGYTYRFATVNNVSAWTRVKDSDITAAKATADAAVPKNQGTDRTWHHLVVGQDGQVTSALAPQLVMTNAAGNKVFVITIGDDGAIIVSEMVDAQGD